MYIDAIYILQTINGRAMEEQKEVYLCFIDCNKKFDRVSYDEIITQLIRLKMEKDLQGIRNMYLDKKEELCVDGEISSLKDRVRQRFMLSPDLFLSLQ